MTAVNNIPSEHASMRSSLSFYQRQLWHESLSGPFMISGTIRISAIHIECRIYLMHLHDACGELRYDLDMQHGLLLDT